MIPTPEERAVRQQVIYRIRQIILQYLPNAAVSRTNRRYFVRKEKFLHLGFLRSTFTEVTRLD